MAKPTTVVSWATDANKTLEPTATRKASGWAAGEKPAARHVNWLFNLLGQWVAYLNGLTSEALTWTAAHTFGAGIEVTGGATLDSAAVTGGATVGGALGVTGGATVGGDLTAAEVTGTCSGTGAGVTGLANATGNTIPAGRRGVFGHGSEESSTVGYSGVYGHGGLLGSPGVYGKSNPLAPASPALAGVWGAGGSAGAVGVIAQGGAGRGDIMFGKSTLVTDPTAPENGDMWIVNDGGAMKLAVRIGGVTYKAVLT